MKGQLKISFPMSLANSPKSTCSQESESGVMPSDKLDGPMIDRSGPDPALANLSPRQAKEKGFLTNDTSGPLSTGTSASVGLALSLASRLQERLENHGSILYRLNWKEKTTPAGRSFFQLVASVRPIKDSGYIGWQSRPAAWPTTNARDWKS